jgi:hypothetical protein
VHLETEHEAFLTTPEHPFATPRSGWIRAGRLARGDWVVSARFGAVRLLSVRSEPAARPVPVFNLSVASSQAYFVGTDRVLVHNTNCRTDNAESLEETISRLTREREEIKRQIRALTKATPTSPRIAELKTQRDELTVKLYRLRAVQRNEQGAAPMSQDERSRRQFEAESEAARNALEDARNGLVELESRPPTSEAERAAFAGRKAKLEKEAAALKLTHERANLILGLLRELAELEKSTPATDAGRRALEERKKELRNNLNVERKRASDLKGIRRKRADPEEREENARYHRNLQRRLLRYPAHLADTERPRDALELLEEELADLRQEAPSESRDARIEHLTDQIDTQKKLVEVRRKYERARDRRHGARRARDMRIAEEGDPSEFDKKLEQAEREMHAARVEIAQLRVRERLLAGLEETPWADAPGAVNEGRLREFERQLLDGLENDQQLAHIERALDQMEPTHADLQEAVLDEAHDVDETLAEREELMRQSPSPERTARLQSSFERLQQELREERVAVEAAVSQLANQYAFIEQTRAGSSRGPTWQERLRAIHQEQVQLRAQRRAGLSARLDSAWRQLNLLRSVEAFRDEAVEADLTREIALLERELQDAGG